MNDLVSIIVPVYNANITIKKCIRSLKEQTYRNIEILIIDDGSTDDSMDICEKLAKDDNRIIVISKRNGGVSSARNEGLKRANGKWIVFVDSDDYINNNLIQLLLLENYNNPGKLIGPMMRIISKIEWVCDYCKKQYTTQNFAKELMNANVLGVCLGYLFEKDKMGYFDERIGYMEDTLFLLEYLKKNITGIQFCDSEYCYMDNENGITKNKQINKIIRNIKDIDLALRTMSFYNSDYFNNCISMKSIIKRKIRLYESEISKISSKKDICVLMNDKQAWSLLTSLKLQYSAIRSMPFVIVVKSNSKSILFLYITIRSCLKNIVRR